MEIFESTPIKEIVCKFRYLNYSKHTDWMHSILDEEKPYVLKAMKVFTEQLGKIKSKDYTWEASFWDDHIKFFNCEKDEYYIYYDMAEIDKRYIDLRIDQWLDEKDMGSHLNY